MKASDLMTPEPITVTEGTSLRTVNDRMKMLRVRHMPVVRGDRLVGIVTHRDVLAASLSKIADPDSEMADEILAQIPVGEVMVEDIYTVKTDTDLVEAINTMLSRKIGCVPVTNGDDELVGIVTESDFVKLTRTLLEASNTDAEEWSPDAPMH